MQREEGGKDETVARSSRPHRERKGKTPKVLVGGGNNRIIWGKPTHAENNTEGNKTPTGVRIKGGKGRTSHSAQV